MTLLVSHNRSLEELRQADAYDPGVLLESTNVYVGEGEMGEAVTGGLRPSTTAQEKSRSVVGPGFSPSQLHAFRKSPGALGSPGGFWRFSQQPQQGKSPLSGSNRNPKVVSCLHSTCTVGPPLRIGPFGLYRRAWCNAEPGFQEAHKYLQDSSRLHFHAWEYTYCNTFLRACLCFKIKSCSEEEKDTHTFKNSYLKGGENNPETND